MNDKKTDSKYAYVEKIHLLLDELNQKPFSEEILNTYKKIIAMINLELEDDEKNQKKCSTCGEQLESWETDLCGSCKITDDNYQEESDN